MIHVEFKGGLGDILYSLYINGAYTQLDALPELERARITLVTQNRGVKDLFEWHPKRKQFDLIDLEFMEPWDDEARAKQGVIPPDEVPGRNTDVVFYPSTEDRVFLAKIPRPFVVFALSAGCQARNIPSYIYGPAARIANDLGFAVVTVGRSYESFTVTEGRRWANVRREERLVDYPGRSFPIIDGIDKLSVPGVMCALRAAAASLCCHSAAMVGAWRVGCPVFACYPEFIKRDEWDQGLHMTFGRDIESTGRASFEEWAPTTFWNYLEKHARK